MSYHSVISAAAAAVVFAGCQGAEREHTSDGVPFKRYNQDKASLYAASLVGDHYGVNLGWPAHVVHWETTICPYSDDPAVIVDGECYYGIMWGCDEIYVATRPDDPTSYTAFLHEYGHCLHMRLTGIDEYCIDGDGDHSDDEFWDVITAAQAESVVRGW